MNTAAKERRALARGRTLGASLFLLIFFLAFEKKVSRRKGETLSRRYRSNEYVHSQQHTGRLSGRLRCDAAPRQVSSYDCLLDTSDSADE